MLRDATPNDGRRQHSVLRQAQDGDPDDPFTRGLRVSYNSLDTEKTAALAAIATLDAADAQEPVRPDPAAPELLDALPQLALDLADAPTELLRALFVATRLTVHMHPDSDDVTIAVTLAAADLQHIGLTAARLPIADARAALASTVGLVSEEMFLFTYGRYL
jgi:site-specific DNA recombinase